MRWWPFGSRRADDDALAGGGERLLVASFGRLFWWFPATRRHRLVQKGRGKYYGMAPAGADWRADGRLHVVSRPDQERDDRLLLIDHRVGRTILRHPLASRDTHHMVRSGAFLYVTDTFRGRVLVYRNDDLRLERVIDRFTHEHHVNSLLVHGGRLYVLCHNRGASRLVALDAASGEELDAFDGAGEHSHDIAPWGARLVICDSRGGALLVLDPAARRSERVFASPGSFTKGLAVRGDVAWFGISRAATREERASVDCEIVAFDLARGALLERVPVPSGGLINSIVTADGLDAQARGG